MAYVLGSKSTADKKSVKFDEFVPSTGWTEDSSSHCLLVDLPDFRQENVKLDVDDSGYITISGERKISDLKYMRFQQTVKIPEDADVNNIIGKFEGGMLQVIVPKQDNEKEETTEEKYKDLEEENGCGSETEKEDEDEKSTSEDGEQQGSQYHLEEREEEEKGAKKEAFVEEGKLEGGEKSTMLIYLVKKIERNKGSVLAIFLAFTLGVLVTRKIDDLGFRNVVCQ